MRRRLDNLALLVRCSELVFGIPATQVDRIIGLSDLEVIAVDGFLRVRVLTEEDSVPGWDLGGLLGKPRRNRETWVICQAPIQGRSRRFVLACDRSLAVVPVEHPLVIPAAMFDSRRGAVTSAFRYTGEASVAYMLDAAKLLTETELAATARGGGVAW